MYQLFINLIFQEEAKLLLLNEYLPVGDFCTLIRNLIVLKLTKLGGFKVRQFLSRNGKYIYIVLHASQENLKIQATLDEIDKEISLSQIDLFSLEPIDKKLRPLRINY